MLEDQPNWPVTRTQGDSVMRFETTTFSTLSPSVSLIEAQRSSNDLASSSRWAFSSSDSSSSRPSFETQTSLRPSNSLSWVTAYSSIGSTRSRTSKPFFLRTSRKGESRTDESDSPVR
jgi:hypothetical protein